MNYALCIEKGPRLCYITATRFRMECYDTVG